MSENPTLEIPAVQHLWPLKLKQRSERAPSLSFLILQTFTQSLRRTISGWVLEEQGGYTARKNRVTKKQLPSWSFHFIWGHCQMCKQMHDMMVDDENYGEESGENLAR